MLTNCLAACTHLSSTVSQLFEPQVQKNRRFHVPQATFLFPLETPCDYHAICCMDGKTIHNACQTPRRKYLSIFNSFRVIRCLSQCASPKIAIFYHNLVSPGDALGAITLNVVWMEREFDAYKLSRCMCSSKFNRFWDICLFFGILSYPLAFDAPVRGLPSEYRHPLWYGKTRMVWLPDGEKISKISLFVLAQLTNVTDARTDGHRVPAIAALCIASHGKNCRCSGRDYKLEHLQ